MDKLSVVRNRIAKLQELERFLDDPETASLIDEISREAAGAPGKPVKAAQPAVENERPRERFISPEGPTNIVLRALPKFTDKQFTHQDMLADLKADGISFNAKDEAIAVSGVLRRLATKAGSGVTLIGKVGPLGAALYQFKKREEGPLLND